MSLLPKRIRPAGNQTNFVLRVGPICRPAAFLHPPLLGAPGHVQPQGGGTALQLMRDQTGVKIFRISAVRHFLIKAVALMCFGVYLWHNFVFWLQGRLAPSLFSSLTGLPCPSTGCTRSLQALATGDWTQSFLWNPFTLPFLGLAALSAVSVGRHWIREKRLELAHPLPLLWLLLLSGAWVTKFAIGSQYW